jgi:Zn-dependent peptidase ImmA (M78 family)/O-acetyl-ADP-ribose deacetylase (regulator of RNase III)
VREEGATRWLWTNPSVKALAPEGDPLTHIAEKARALVFDALENGWQGPPFDPFWLAEHRGIKVMPRDDVPDARLVPSDKGKDTIEYNPIQPNTRIRFSLAHEISHTLFPDYRDATRNRLQLMRQRGDDWQLELLCNVAAAELLMPSESIGTKLSNNFDIDRLIRLGEEYEVSPEAFLIRTVRSTNQPITIFAAARVGEPSPSYRLDYCIPSSSSPIRLSRGLSLPSNTILSECTAISFTAKGTERWAGLEVFVECVGVPPYRGETFPRVVGILSARDTATIDQLQIQYLRGSVTQPRGDGNKIVTHIVNDKASTWGAGAARAIADKWPVAHSDFKNWTIARKDEFGLGIVHRCEISKDLTIVSMVAQHGYGDSKRPRIRYAALRDCLKELATIAVSRKASIHMPRIGTGYAGGNWVVIEDLITETIIAEGVRVTVYTLPKGRQNDQTFLDEDFTS